MALSGIQVYKMLPQTNCKECGFPTCLAFSMKLAAKQVELDDCPYVTEESKKKLAESAAPPIRLIKLKAKDREVAVGNEVAAVPAREEILQPAGSSDSGRGHRRA